jgi:hypothetical protein
MTPAFMREALADDLPDNVRKKLGVCNPNKWQVRGVPASLRR